MVLLTQNDKALYEDQLDYISEARQARMNDDFNKYS